jgi:hypothetical protein
MKNESTICPPIAGVGGMTDLEVFGCFNIEIDENGNDLWEFRVIPKERKPARELHQDMVPVEADLMVDKTGRAGDESRIVALARFYQNQIKDKTEKSAFLPLTD